MSRHRVIPCELANRLRRSAVARTSRHAVHARSRSRRSVALLRDARGVGLRVSWSGECGDLDVRCLQYLDPPRQPDGTLAWSPRADAQLLARRGPTFISVDDTRHGPRRRIVIDRSTPERTFSRPSTGDEITTMERRHLQPHTGRLGFLFW
ncbi:DUF5825 family protein [Streptomyces chartreusis]